MAFVSLEYSGNPGNGKSRKGKYPYVLIDSEFGSIDVWGETSSRGREVAHIIIREYGQRGLSIARNLALATMWYSKCYSVSIKSAITLMDQFCVSVDYWAQYAKERDIALEKLLVLK